MQLFMRNDITMCLGRNIRLYRQKTGLTQRAFAERAGISAGYVALLEKGEKYPSAEVLSRLECVLDVPAARMFANDRDVLAHNNGAPW